MSTASLNEVRLIGNVGADPEGRTTEGGKRVVNLSLATTGYSGDREFTEWHRIVFWGPLAERVEKSVRKGSSIYVGGRLQANTWTDNDGGKHYGVDIVADQLQLLGGKRPGAEQGEQQGDDNSNAPAQAPAPDRSKSKSANVKETPAPF